MIKKNRGLSMIVATVLILLITFVLAAILAQTIIPFVKDNLKQGTECLPYKDYFQFDTSFEYNCLQSDGSDYVHHISVKAISADNSTAEKVAGFNLILKTDSEGKAISVKNGIVESCIIGGIKKFESLCSNLQTIEIPRTGEVRSYTYRDSVQIKKVEIAPILDSGRICEVSNSIKLIKCGLIS